MYFNCTLLLTACASSLFGQNELAPPFFSQPAGFYFEDFKLHISHTDSNATIVYSIDGSEPLFSNIGGKVYTYKNSYAQLPNQTSGPLLNNSFESSIYSDSLLIENRSYKPNNISLISTTFNHNPYYFPSHSNYKINTIRARAYSNNDSSKVVSASYLVFEDSLFISSFPIISICVDEDAFFDYEKGIYVAGEDFDAWRLASPNATPHGGTQANYTRRGIETEKVVNFEFFEKNGGNAILNQLIGARIHGGYSRAAKNKNLRLYARSDYDTVSTFNHQIFEDYHFDRFKRLILRNSGNDRNTTYFRDAFLQRAIRHLKLETQAFRPAHVFLNGEYWGILNIRTRYDKHYFERVFGIQENELDYLSRYEEAIEGDDAHYLFMKNHIEENDMADSTHFALAQTLLDVNNFLDYYAAQIYIANADWPGNNIDFFRKRTDSLEQNAPYGQDGRWRWLVFDTDFGFGLPSALDYTHNTLEMATQMGGTSWPNPEWATTLLVHLLDNESFKFQFINRFADLMNTAFLPERIDTLVDAFYELYQPEIFYHQNRWGTLSNWQSNIQELKNFGQQRPEPMIQHLKDKFSLSEMYHLTLNVSNLEKGFVEINTTTINNKTPGVDFQSYPWSGKYFKGVPVKLKAHHYPGAKFSHWSVNQFKISEESEIELIFQQDTEITAHFELDSIEDGVLLQFWMFDNKIPNNLPLSNLKSTFNNIHHPKGDLNFTSCKEAYPFDNTHPLWRKASLERRNLPIPTNYRKSANENIPYTESEMRGIQVKAPFKIDDRENEIEFSFSTKNFENIQFSLVALSENNGPSMMLVDYYDAETSTWVNFKAFNLYTFYVFYQIDFSEITSLNNQNSFKTRLRFDAETETIGENGAVVLNNIAISGTPINKGSNTAISFNEKEIVKVFPNPTQDYINIVTPTLGKSSVAIYSALGKTMYQSTFTNVLKVDFTSFATGIYFIETRLPNEKPFVQKVIKH